MKLIEFSVTNYRSITKAHKIVLQNLTILVGKNNEGKSNLLRALNVAMTAVMMYGRSDEKNSTYLIDRIYNWKQDFPKQLQDRQRGLESIFRLNFKLEENELEEFHNQMNIRGNDIVPIEVKFDKNNSYKLAIPKRGSAAYKRKDKNIMKFISERISFNYIQAVRTEGMAINALQRAISEELISLKDNIDYVDAQNKVNQLRQEVLNKIAEQLVEPLKVFLPNLKDVSIIGSTDTYGMQYYHGDFDVIINDGLATSITNKGDGIKSLVTLAILKDRRKRTGASIIAIEEPESHLHSGAIHGLVDVINKMSDNNQVIITTHNPLFVQQNKLNANIIVDNGTARVAKNISEIRNTLGVLPSDNLRNSRHVLVVEGENDKIALTKILPFYSNKIKVALDNNRLVIKPLAGVNNLSHDLFDLKNSMCKYIVLLDNDQAGKGAYETAKQKGLLKESEVRFTMCNGSPESEFEDCLNPRIYADVINEKFCVDILKGNNFKGNEKWSDRVKKTFCAQGLSWTEEIQKNVKKVVANAIPERSDNIDEIIIEQKSGFLKSLVTMLEDLISVL